MSLLTPDAVTRFREERGEPALVVAFVVGVGLGAVHWGGLVVAGALVGLLAPTYRRSFLYGLYFGGTFLFAFGLWLLLWGTLGRAAGMGQLTLLSVAVGLAFPTLSAGAVRGLV